MAATLGNFGPGLGAVDPTDNYAQLPAVGKWLLSLFMLLGQLEIFTHDRAVFTGRLAHNRAFPTEINYANTSGISGPRRITDGLQRDDAGTRHSFFFLRRRGQ